MHTDEMTRKPTPKPVRLPKEAVALAELRQLLGRTQVETAAAAGMDQSELSKAERRDGHRVSTLRRYVEALGGELEVRARFGKASVVLRGV